MLSYFIPLTKKEPYDVKANFFLNKNYPFFLKILLIKLLENY